MPNSGRCVSSYASACILLKLAAIVNFSLVVRIRARPITGAFAIGFPGTVQMVLIRMA